MSKCITGMSTVQSKAMRQGFRWHGEFKKEKENLLTWCFLKEWYLTVCFTDEVYKQSTADGRCRKGQGESV